MTQRDRRSVPQSVHTRIPIAGGAAEISTCTTSGAQHICTAHRTQAPS